MVKRRQLVAVAGKPGGLPVADYDRYISRKGLEHLRSKLPSLRREIESLQQRIADAAEESRDDSSSRDDMVRQKLVFENDVRDIESFLKVAIVIEDSPEYQRLPEGEVWFGCAVSYHDDCDFEGVGHIVLLNTRERDNRGYLTEICRKHARVPSDETVDIASGGLPLTQALLGHRAGEIVEVMMGGRAHHLNILAVTKILDRQS